METEFIKTEEQPVRPKESGVGNIGPGQLIVSRSSENQETTDPIQHNQQNETVIEANSVTDPTAEIGMVEDVTNNKMEDKMETNRETKNESKDNGKDMVNPEMGAEPDQGSSQNHNQGVEDQSTAIVNPLEGCLVGEDVTLAPRQAIGLATLFTTSSIAEASRITKIPERTLRRWITEPKFIAAYKEAIKAVKQVYIIDTLSQLELAIQARRDLLENPTQPGAAIKEKIADKIIKSCEKAIEMLTIEDRVDRLERLVG